MGNEVPGVFSLKVCFGSHPGEPKVLRMKTTVASCTNERQSIASEKVIYKIHSTASSVWRKVNTFEMLGLQSPVFSVCM